MALRHRIACFLEAGCGPGTARGRILRNSPLDTDTPLWPCDQFKTCTEEQVGRFRPVLLLPASGAKCAGRSANHRTSCASLFRNVGLNIGHHEPSRAGFLMICSCGRGDYSSSSSNRDSMNRSYTAFSSCSSSMVTSSSSSPLSETTLRIMSPSSSPFSSSAESTGKKDI